MLRTFPRPVKKIVVKIGSRGVADQNFKPRPDRLPSLVRQLSQLTQEKIEVVLVSSGAIVLGMGELGLSTRPTDLASLQALAAVGQAVLMRTYAQLFGQSQVKCGQVLLTWDDFDNRTRRNNARNTLQSILDHGAVPIINENDTISTEEIKFGDNDKLSAFVASLIDADLLVILSDVEGLYDPNDAGKRVFDVIKDITPEIEGLASGPAHGSQVSRGGMTAKLDAIKIASHSRIPCVIAHGGTEDVLIRILAGERVGTFFLEKEEKLLARKHWLAFVAKPKGVVVVDEGAKDALLKGARSLLLPGVLSWDGHFKAEDVVIVCDQDKAEIGRGIINYSVSDLHKLDTKKGKKEVIHCDDLLITRK